MKKLFRLETFFFTCLFSLTCLSAAVAENTEQDIKTRFFNTIEEGIGWISGETTAEPGVVATVNKQPIYFKQVEGLFDMEQALASENRVFTVEELRTAYQNALFELIVQHLVHQTIEQTGVADLQVTEKDVAALESMARSGYPNHPDAPTFEEILEQDGIDIELWREQLRAQLEQERLQQHLATTIRLSPEEMAEYQKKHKDTFIHPAAYDVAIISAPTKAELEAIRELLPDAPKVLRFLGTQLDGVEVTHFPEFHVNSLPDIWRKDAAKMPKGTALAPVQIEGGWRMLVLLDRKEARPFSQAEIFHVLETELTLAALEKTYADWLEKSLSEAQIYVNKALLFGKTAE